MEVEIEYMDIRDEIYKFMLLISITKDQQGTNVSYQNKPDTFFLRIQKVIVDLNSQISIISADRILNLIPLISVILDRVLELIR